MITKIDHTAPNFVRSSLTLNYSCARCEETLFYVKRLTQKSVHVVVHDADGFYEFNVFNVGSDDQTIANDLADSEKSARTGNTW